MDLRKSQCENKEPHSAHGYVLFVSNNGTPEVLQCPGVEKVPSIEETVPNRWCGEREDHEGHTFELSSDNFGFEPITAWCRGIKRNPDPSTIVEEVFCFNTNPHERHYMKLMIAGTGKAKTTVCPGVKEPTVECVACQKPIKSGDLVEEVKKIRYIPENHHQSFELPATLAGYRHLRCPRKRRVEYI